MHIISREAWGARHPGGDRDAPLPAREVWLHHSVTTAPPVTASPELDAAAVRLLEEIGQARFGAGISYTFVIPPSGRVFEGHGVHRRGTHTGGRNTTSRGICLLGDYEATRPTDQQVAAVAALLAYGERERWWVEAALAGGHRDVKATACPGEHAYRLIPEINRRAATYSGALPLEEDDAVWATPLPDLYPGALDQQGRPTRDIDAGTQLAFATARSAQAVDLGHAILREIAGLRGEVAGLRAELLEREQSRIDAQVRYRLVPAE